jgi:hypothetical protein
MTSLVKIAVTLVLGLLLSAGFSVLLERGQASFYVHKYSRMKELFARQTAYDILFIGSSRTHTTINPQVIDSITGFNTYNAGAEGGNLYEFKLTLDGYLESHAAPRMVVISIDVHSLRLSNRKIFFPIQYFWVLQNRKIADAIRSSGEYRYLYIRHLEFLRQIYYSDYMKSLALRGLLGQNELEYTGFAEWKGYATNGMTCADTTLQYDLYEEEMNQEAVYMLQAMIDTCKKRNIRVELNYLPEYKGKLQATIANFSHFTKIVADVALANNLNFVRDDTLTMCHNHCFFANYGHVNTVGANEYSMILGKRLLDSLESRPGTGKP